MPTLNIKDDTMQKVEEIQESFDAKPSKREVARRAFTEYLEKREGE